MRAFILRASFAALLLLPTNARAQSLSLTEAEALARLSMESPRVRAIRSAVGLARADVLVAFRVVRQDTDGSLIIAWKLLQKYPMPKLARNQLNN